MDSQNTEWIINRRDFLKSSATVGATVISTSTYAATTTSKLRFGMVTDPHYADIDSRGSRYYRQSLAKVKECVDFMEQQVDFLIELGDFKDEDSQPNEALTLSYLRSIENVFRSGVERTYHVLGNHDLDSISKSQFLSETTNTGISPEATFYNFSLAGFQFIVLDANFRSDDEAYDHGNFDWTDANIPADQLGWLKQQLNANPFPAIVFVHQLLDGIGSHYINNASEVRGLLEASGKVQAVFHGHQHAGQYNRINGIHYYTLQAVVEGKGEENNAYAIVEIDADNNLSVIGYRKATSKNLDA